MAAEDNLIMTGDLAKAQSIDFVERFGYNVNALLEALNVTRRLPLQAGMLVKTYTTVVTEAAEQVGEGELVPLTKVVQTAGDPYEITLKKYRKAVSGEAIQRAGYDNAVAETDEKMINHIQKDIRTRLFDFMKTGEGVAEGVGLQEALAIAWGEVQTIFEDDAAEVVAFVNPKDVAKYLGNANITMQKEFGMTFVEGFTDVKVIANANVEEGKLYATAAENLVFAYVPVNGSELGRAFDLTGDATGYVGITHYQNNQNVTLETLALAGNVLFAERLDGVIIGTITEPAEG